MKVSKKRSAAQSVTKSRGIAGANRLRIIGGRWRSVPLRFPDVAAIRPTPDRVRETLFNWLQQAVIGARCLDLFAGSGALGLEALSRGAREVVFVDREAAIGHHLRDTLKQLQCIDAQVITSDALAFLKQAASPFDVIFLDPPFALSATELLPQLYLRLEQGWLNANAWIYLECPSNINPLTLKGWPASWRLHRSKQAGQVGYHLAQRIAVTQA